MQRTTYEFVEVSSGGSLRSPIILRQNNRKFARLPGLLLMTTMAGLIVAPQIAFASGWVWSAGRCAACCRP